MKSIVCACYAFSFIIIMSLPVKADVGGFCFDDETKLSSVRRHLYPILLRGDKMKKAPTEQGNCFEIDLIPSRHQLFKKFIGKKYKIARYYNLSDNAPEKEVEQEKLCNLELKNRGQISKYLVDSKKGVRVNYGKTRLSLSCKDAEDQLQLIVRFENGKEKLVPARPDEFQLLDTLLEQWGTIKEGEFKDHFAFKLY